MRYLSVLLIFLLNLFLLAGCNANETEEPDARTDAISEEEIISGNDRSERDADEDLNADTEKNVFSSEKAKKIAGEAVEAWLLIAEISSDDDAFVKNDKTYYYIDGDVATDKAALHDYLNRYITESFSKEIIKDMDVTEYEGRPARPEASEITVKDMRNFLDGLEETEVTPEHESATEAEYLFNVSHSMEKGTALLINFIFKDGRWLVDNITPEKCC